ncbi:hypothetical protein [Parvicella tangerina]|uniref:hypothetical protein n=1 Tax=Parvicella tangerina TaxID=2829795 RepID=UPI00215B82A1|nr:hypothetical protein [Parvicella tangerina]
MRDILVSESGALAEIPGHRYRLYNVESDDYQVIRLFMNASGVVNSDRKGWTKNGTTIEEVTRMLLDYFEVQEYLYPSLKNTIIKNKLEEILAELCE